MRMAKIIEILKIAVSIVSQVSHTRLASQSAVRGKHRSKNTLVYQKAALLKVSDGFRWKPIAILGVLALCGCSNAVTRVSIPVKVESEIDITRYSNFAVLPFVSEKQVERNEKLPPEVGEEIASILRRGLARQKHFEVVSTQETARMLTGETVEEDWLTDTKHLSKLGEYFEVKAVIIGSFRFYSDSRPRRYYGERYSVRRQRYVLDYQDYMQKTYLLSLRVMIVDVETEQIVWDESYRRSTAEAHTIGSFIFSQVGPQANTIRELGRRAVSEFTRQISPHYESEDRYLVN